MPISPPPEQTTGRGHTPDQGLSSISQYFAAARSGNHHWWHWLFGVVFILGLYFIGAAILFIGIYGYSDSLSASGDVSITSLELLEYLALVTSFLPLFIAVFAIYKFWHQRAIRALLTYTARFRWTYLIRGGLATFGVYALVAPIAFYFDPEEFETLAFIADWKLFAIGLAMTLAFIPIQAAAEEIAIRGYLNQALIKYVKYPWAAFVITSALFAWLHASNPEAAGQMLPYMISIFGFGVLMCLLLYVEGGLESAIGVHVANNIFSFSIIGYEDPDLPELALWSTGPPEISLGDSLLELGIVAITVGIVLLWNRWATRRPSINQSGL